MAKQKYEVTAQVPAYRTCTVSAESEQDAVEMADQRFRRRGIETIGGFYVQPVNPKIKRDS